MGGEVERAARARTARGLLRINVQMNVRSILAMPCFY